MPHPRNLTPAITLAGLMVATGSAAAQTIGFDLGVTASRVGDGLKALSAAAAPVYLDQFAIHVSVDLSANLPVPSFSASRTGSTLTPLLAAGNDNSQGVLTASADRRTLLLGGTAAAGGATMLYDWRTTAAAQGVLDSAQPAATLPAGPVRGGWTAGDSGFYTAHAGIALGSFDGSVPTTSVNGSGMNTDVRQLGVAPAFGSGSVLGAGASVATQLYFAAGSGGGTAGVYQLGSGLPTIAGGSTTLLAATRNGAAANGFFFADLSLDMPGMDTLYVGTEGDGLQKFSLLAQPDGSRAWVFSGALSSVTTRQLGSTTTDTRSVVGLDGLSAPSFSFTASDGTEVTLPSMALAMATVQHHVVVRNAAGAVVSDTTSTSLEAFTDLSGYAGTLTAPLAGLSTLLTGAAFDQESLRGVAVTSLPALPVPEPGRLPMLASGLLVLGFLARRRTSGA